MKTTRLAQLASLAVVGSMALAACGSDNTTGTTSAEGSSSSASASESAATECFSGTINAEGSSAQKNAIEEAIASYGEACKDAKLNYNPTGSGAGIKQFTEGLVTFGASDAAMTDEQIAQVQGGVVLLPMTAGSIVLAYNLPGGPSDVRLSRDAYVGIFLGKVTRWNDPAIVATNPGTALPDTPITVVTRSDGSGTTFVFTTHLAEISDAWKSGPGAGTSVQWPAGVGGKGNAGVTALLKQTPGAIGYVEYGYAQQTGLTTATLQNKSGAYVKADLKSGQAALASVTLPENLRAWIPDPAAAGAYPIVTYTWLLCHRKYDDAKVASALESDPSRRALELICRMFMVQSSGVVLR